MTAEIFRALFVIACVASPGMADKGKEKLCCGIMTYNWYLAD